MAWYPFAVRKEVSRFRTPMTPNRINLHTAVTSSTSLFGYFNQPGVVCSHFYIREDGVVEQYIDTRFRAAADLQGNPDTISIETWDGYKRLWTKTTDLPAWTPAQVNSLAALLAWLAAEHNIPLTQVPDSRPGRRGVGYHRQGISPWKVQGGLTFSNSYGKVCPGDRRVDQIGNILSLARSGRGPEPTTPSRSRGYSVVYAKEVQTLLNLVAGERLLVDGILGPVSEAAVRRFQASRGLVVDGDPGPITMARLRAEALEKAPQPVTPPKTPGPDAHGGIFPLRRDGLWGPVTTQALQIRLAVPQSKVLDRTTIVRMQSLMRLKEDGVFGPVTKQTLKNRLGVVDGGYGYFGPKATRSLQARLNGGVF